MNSDTIRVNISAPRQFIAELKALVSKGDISRFLIEAAKEKLEREKRMKAMQRVRELADPFPEVENASQYIHEKRARDEEHRQSKLGV